MKLLRKVSFLHTGPRYWVDENVLFNEHVETIRRTEYPMLQGLTYLDHAGTTLPSKTLIETFAHQLQTHLLANPHSASATTPSISQIIVESTRMSVLELFNASPDHFEVVFVANATAAIKLVLEAFRGYDEGFDYYYHRDSHTSIVGGRELARRSRCLLSDQETEQWLENGEPQPREDASARPTLFAYPAQSNMNGRRLPLSWPSTIRNSHSHKETYTLLDVAALVSTSPLDLSDPTSAPDFLALSFYKIFGFPNLGALLVRKPAAHVFDQRQYFGGGTTDMITCTTSPWSARKTTTLSARLEDGTGPTHSILALHCAIDIHRAHYGGLAQTSRHTTWLAKHLYDRLARLQHANGTPACRIYKDASSTYGDAGTQGATVAFNLRDANGAWVSGARVGELAAARGIHVRTGGLCNPAGMAHALGHRDEDMRRMYDLGFRCGHREDVRDGVPVGMVRASLGACSTLGDVKVFVDFVEECFLERADGTCGMAGAGEEVGGGEGGLARGRRSSLVERGRGRRFWSSLTFCRPSRLRV